MSKSLQKREKTETERPKMVDEMFFLCGICQIRTETSIVLGCLVAGWNEGVIWEKLQQDRGEDTGGKLHGWKRIRCLRGLGGRGGSATGGEMQRARSMT